MSAVLDGVERIAAALDAEPLFHMSLGSKELFHSNMLAWLAKRHPRAARAVFSDWTGSDPAQTAEEVERELHSLDLVLKMPGLAVLVVENKVFSLPDTDQLERYASEKVPELLPSKRKRGALKEPSLVLLSLSDPGWPAGEWRGKAGTWRWRSYRELQRSLALQVDAVRSEDAYEGETVARYCALISTLIELSDVISVRNDEEDIELDRQVLGPLESCRIADGVKKLRMHQVARRLDEQLRASDVRVKLAVSLSRKQPLLEGFVTFDGKNDVGWQYQSGEFRLAMRIHAHRGKTQDAEALRRAFATGNQAWFDFTEAAEIFGSAPDRHKTRVAPDEFRQFEHFLYLRHIPQRISVAQMLAVAMTYSRKAVDFAARYGS